MGENIKLVKDSDEKIIEIEIERLKDFDKHPFKVEMDAQMIELKESIEKYGILTPLIVRPMMDGTYEIISGHRRKFAAECLGFHKVPVIIRVLSDKEAVIAMVDSNLQREFVNHSEKAFAYKMKYDVIKRHGGYQKSSQDGYNYKGKRTVEVLAEEFGDSPRQVQRYLKITELVPEMLERLDLGRISINPAVEIAYLKEEEQRAFMEAMDYTQSSPTLSQAQRIKKLSQRNQLSLEEMKKIMSEKDKREKGRIFLSTDFLYKYFPKSYTPARIKMELADIIKLWKEQYMEG